MLARAAATPIAVTHPARVPLRTLCPVRFGITLSATQDARLPNPPATLCAANLVTERGTREPSGTSATVTNARYKAVRDNRQSRRLIILESSARIERRDAETPSGRVRTS